MGKRILRYRMFGTNPNMIKLSTDMFQKHAATYKSLYGQRFGRLLVIDDLGFFIKDGTATPRHYVKCICDCGNSDEIIADAESLKKGTTKSCGCLSREINIEKGTKHGLHKSKIYKTYYGMLDRCNNPNSVNYYKYGKRGISVCEEWQNDFMAFYNWSMENGFADNLSIDRINVNGNYEPSNCRWATVEQQSNNKTTSKYITYQGKTQTIAQWAREFNLEYKTLQDRVKKGWDIDKLFEQPKHPKKRKD